MNSFVFIPTQSQNITLKACFFFHGDIRACSVGSNSFATPWSVARQTPYPWNFPGNNTGAGCYFLLQAIFPTQGSSPLLFHLLHWHVGSLPAEPPGKAFPWRKEPHKGKELGSRQSMRSSPATHTTLVPNAFPCGPGLCSSEQKMISGAWLGPESHGQ